jgi:hypothetical protein
VEVVDQMKPPMIIVDEDGTKEWRLNDKLHREDGPAVEYANGNKYWYIHDNLHRTDGPAVEWSNGRKEWYINGKIHREDGPAMEYADGKKSWYLYDKRYNTFDRYAEAAKWTDEQIVLWKLTNENT